MWSKRELLCIFKISLFFSLSHVSYFVDGRELKVNLHSKVIGDPELQITKTKLKLTFKKIECDHWTNLESVRTNFLCFLAFTFICA